MRRCRDIVERRVDRVGMQHTPVSVRRFKLVGYDVKPWWEDDIRRSFLHDLYCVIKEAVCAVVELKILLKFHSCVVVDVKLVRKPIQFFFGAIYRANDLLKRVFCSAVWTNHLLCRFGSIFDMVVFALVAEKSNLYHMDSYMHMPEYIKKEI